ncbi:MAG: hypothetical protein J2P19_35785, partial [Pseudonocardia sp.]|nr:hypothetical protein [Pseudonocardia sp.]
MHTTGILAVAVLRDRGANARQIDPHSVRMHTTGILAVAALRDRGANARQIDPHGVRMHTTGILAVAVRVVAVRFGIDDRLVIVSRGALP